MAVELEALRFGGIVQPVEVGVEIGDAFVGVERHRLFKVAHLPLHRRPHAKGQVPGLPVPSALPTPWLMKTAFPFALAAVLLASAASAQPIDPKVQARIDRILKATPLIDGHNDLAEQLRENYEGRTEGLAGGTDKWKPALMTDMARLHQGRVGGQFWSVFIPAEVDGDRAIRDTLEEIDIVKRFVAAYPNDLEQAYSAGDLVRIHKAGRVASLIGIEGGHQMGHSFAALRMFHDLGARYMTLTHFKTTDWADCATDVPNMTASARSARASSTR